LSYCAPRNELPLPGTRHREASSSLPELFGWSTLWPVRRRSPGRTPLMLNVL
jgi:hypothetical protein